MDRARAHDEGHVAVGVHITEPLVHAPQLDDRRRAVDRPAPSYFAM
jgi:hypothetical protein